MNLVSRCALMCTLTLVAACGDSISPNEREFGTVSASIDGASFSAPLAANALKSGVVNTRVVIIASQGDNPKKQLNLIVNGVSGPGTLTVSAASGTHIVYTETTGSTVVGWTTALPGGSGTITITEIKTEGTSGKFIGTFTDVVLVPASGGATGNKTVTNGVFKVNLLFQ